MTDAIEPLAGYADWGDRVWLNTAHQGALPLAAAQEAREAIDWKLQPFELTQERFDGVPARLREALGALCGVPAHEIVLANSASYGLNLIASAFPWEPGDEVLVMEGDFPSDILPWLLLERRHGVKVVRIRPAGDVVECEELEAAISARTRLFCTTWVHSFSGRMIDVEALGTACRAHDVAFVLNGSQAVGTGPLSLSELAVDAVTSVGFKWLTGPYGTGFLWLRPELRRRLAATKAYWLSMLTAADLERGIDRFELAASPGERDFDVFGTANFFNFRPFAASVEHVLSTGLDRIRTHDQSLVSRFLDGLDRDAYEVTSRLEPGDRRSTLVLFSHRVPERNEGIQRGLRDRGIYLAARNGRLRLSPHLYNGSDHIDRALEALDCLK